MYIMAESQAATRKHSLCESPWSPLAPSRVAQNAWHCCFRCWTSCPNDILANQTATQKHSLAYVGCQLQGGLTTSSRGANPSHIASRNFFMLIFANIYFLFFYVRRTPKKHVGLFFWSREPCQIFFWNLKKMSNSNIVTWLPFIILSLSQYLGTKLFLAV